MYSPPIILKKKKRRIEVNDLQSVFAIKNPNVSTKTKPKHSSKKQN